MNSLIDNGVSIEIIRTKRQKTASIKIANGSVQAYMPNELSDFKIKELLKKRKLWIKRKLEEEAKVVIASPKEYVNGESFSYLGRNYRLKLIQSKKTDVKLKGGYLEVHHPKNFKNKNVKDLLIAWYEKHALERLKEKTERYSKIIGVKPVSVNIKDYKSRWGSCSSNGDILYNWRIIIAPHKIIDYVVVHELCHILEHNHSKKYWRHVSNNFHNYVECQNWLKFNGRTLTI